jgi:hypothetical protein
VRGERAVRADVVGPDFVVMVRGCEGGGDVGADWEDWLEEGFVAWDGRAECARKAARKEEKNGRCGWVGMLDIGCR